MESAETASLQQDSEGQQRREELYTGRETDPSMHWFEAAATMEAVNGKIEAEHLVGLIGWLFLAGPNLEVRWDWLQNLSVVNQVLATWGWLPQTLRDVLVGYQSAEI